MPYSKVKSMLSSPESAAKAKEMAKKNNVLLMAGEPINGKAVTMTGEVTGADCYLSQGEHGEHHALCSKACVSHGGPMVFLAQNGTVYLVLSPKDGKPYPSEVLNALGKPGVTVHANELDSHGIKALSIQSVEG